MPHPRLSVLGLSLAAALAACSPRGGQTPQPPVPDVSQDAAALRAGEIQWNEDFKGRFLEPLVGYYSHDAVFLAPGAAPARGSDAIRAMLTDMLDDPKFALSFAPDKVVVAASGDLAYATGGYAQTASNPKTNAADHRAGAYVIVYRKASNGAWKAVASILTPGPPSP